VRVPTYAIDRKPEQLLAAAEHYGVTPAEKLAEPEQHYETKSRQRSRKVFPTAKPSDNPTDRDTNAASLSQVASSAPAAAAPDEAGTAQHQLPEHHAA